MQIKEKSLLVFIITFIFGGSFSQCLAYEENLNIARTNPSILNCEEVKNRINTMLELHYQYDQFTEELFSRTMNKMGESLDQNKIYLLQSDIENISHKAKYYLTDLSKNNCNFVFDFYKLFSKRVEERNNTIKKILTNIDKKKETEYFNANKNNWAKSYPELYRTLKSKLKLQYLKEVTAKNNIDIKSKIEKKYLKFEKNLSSLDSDKLFGNFLNSFALALDPHSAHMLPNEHDSFVIHISNKLEGIGAQLIEKEGEIYIKSLVNGGVAQKDGRIKPNDKILAVDPGNGSGFQYLFDVDVDKAVSLIRGKKGSLLKMYLQRPTSKGYEKINVSLLRDEIELKDDKVNSTIIELQNIKIGVIKIPTFYTDIKCKIKLLDTCKGVAYDTEKELIKLNDNGAKGIVIDLRNNGGGDFPESIKLTSLFIPKGTIVQTLDKYHIQKKYNVEQNSWLYKGPLVILVNHLSASASEIFSAAIQDYGRGIIVGDKKTYGKGTIQIVQEIPGTFGRKTDGAVKVTQSKFYRATGKSNQMVGVETNINLPSLQEGFDTGEENQDYALSFDSILPASDFKPLKNNANLINKLNILSEKRISINEKYKSLINKINAFKLGKSTLIPILSSNLKLIEDYLSSKENDENLEEDNKKFVIDKDLQLSESILVMKDIINLPNENWVSYSNAK
ncbi:carboxy terminal-processing peptidase [Pigmentibacter sp. JX0631]|uniref:carboxy terminal-processing peptidase n=1 Tax=Pigmentibacter sp. JX0631 TaxID=2976982 RepID=UPI00246895DC|nr:carboxy terminal-processing peptidase [Pigmentibacter sp. JX0631]WGL59347.1 carboxy terminal-processing peptidase [Pigmentibacter sp. JX0631]